MESSSVSVLELPSPNPISQSAAVYARLPKVTVSRCRECREILVTQPIIHTLVPGQDPIPLIAYYPSFAAYYPTCELATKRWFVSNAKPDWCYIDAGANIGYYSILFSRLSPQGRVFAFEPTSTAEMMKHNLAHNGVTNVEIVEQALGNASGDIEDNIYRVWGEAPERQQYPFTTIDEFVRLRKPPRLDCIKIDVDSFDLDVLFGAEQVLREWDPYVIVELNHALSLRQQSNMEALEWLYDQGYRQSLFLDHDNFVLKRSTNARLTGSEKTFTIHFAPTLSADDVLVEGMGKLRQVPNAIAQTPVVHAGKLLMQASGNGPAGIAATTDGPPWSYCLSFPLSNVARTAGSGTNRRVFAVRVIVRHGNLGIGLVGADYSSFVGREQILSKSPDEQVVRVVTEEPASAAYLMFRNGPRRGETHFEILSIECFESEAG